MEVSLLNRQRFRDILQDYKIVSRKSMGQAINNALGDVALTAIRTTYKTNAAKIDADLSRVQTTSSPVYETKRGFKAAAMRKDKFGNWRPQEWSRKIRTSRFKKKQVATVGTYKLVNWILKNQGLRPIGNTKVGIAGIGFGKSSGKQGTIGKFAQNLIAARKRSIQFLAIGWAGAAKVFGKRPTKGDFGDKTIERTGGGIKAQEDKALVEGVIFNNAGSRDVRYFPPGKRTPSGIVKIGMPGIVSAMNEVLTDPKRGIIPYIKARLDRLPYSRRKAYGG
ncbi:MAG: hypothetical protein EBR82_43720 [Caulobacteraceae bacterium]|nr:hypothetical protein [Caulobacteraceae bacterium]